MTTSLKPGDVVTFHQPLDLARHGQELGQIVRLRNERWGAGADVRTFASSYTRWVDLRYLHVVDEPTYRRWLAVRTPAPTPKPVPEPETTWQERHDARQVDRAVLISAAHGQVVETLQRLNRPSSGGDAA